ncbi:unnamed protein product, partial [Didymodactylos carnosus]
MGRAKSTEKDRGGKSNRTKRNLGGRVNGVRRLNATLAAFEDDEQASTSTLSRITVSKTSDERTRSTTTYTSNSTATNSLNSDQDTEQQEEGDLEPQPKQASIWKHCKKLAEIFTPNWSTTGCRAHLYKDHKMMEFAPVLKTGRNQQLTPFEKKELNELCIEGIVEDGRSFGDLRRKGIMKIFNRLLPGFRPPNRSTVQRSLKRLNNQKKSDLKTELQVARHIGITTDFWSDRRTVSYLAITGHFIDDNFKFISKILSFTTFAERHCGTNIATEIENRLKDLNIFNKVKTITADGASNMIVACANLSDDISRIWCIGHKFHLVVTNGLCLWGKSKKDKDDNSGIDALNDAIRAMSTEDLSDDLTTVAATTTSAAGMINDQQADVDIASEDESGLDDDIDDSVVAANDITNDDNWALDVIDEDSEMAQYLTVEEENISSVIEKMRNLIKMI